MDSNKGSISKLRLHHEVKKSARLLNQNIEQLSNAMNRDKENVHDNLLNMANNPPKMYPNSEYQKRLLVKGQHLVKKLREVRDQDRRAVMLEMENASKTLEVDDAPIESRAHMYESVLNIVDRHKMKLQVGCRRQGQNMS